MSILIPSCSADDWKAFLAEPDKHWRSGYSAKTLAYCWHEAGGFPACVRKAFQASGLGHLTAAELLLAIPEHKVDLPGGRRPSQNDLFVLARCPEGHISIMVEGKVNEEFGPLVSEWSVGASDGKQERLRYLLGVLGLDGRGLDSVRYQLLHRAASAVIEARRYCARHAVMLVHSFSAEKARFGDYARFAALFGVKAEAGTVQSAATLKEGIRLSLGWVCGDLTFLQR